MQTRLKIDLSNGIVEVEGDEKLVKDVYTDFKEILLKHKEESIKKSVQRELVEDKGKGAKAPKRKRGKASTRKEKHSLVKSLNLEPKGGTSLKAFYKEKAPSTNMERNAVFTYHLQKNANVEAITPDHIYTCYKHVSERVPGALMQSLLDTASRRGWIDTANTDAIVITIPGENLVERDLPKPTKGRSKT